MKWNIIDFDTLESTNITALSYPAYSIIRAATQTAGKGRHGRAWESPRGNLYASFVLPDFGKEAALVSFIIALSAGQMLSTLCPGISLKWPNDILRDGKKIAGILLEKTDDKLIVGIGINLKSHPTKAVLYPTASLNTAFDPQGILHRLIVYFDKNLTLYTQQGFAPIQSAWKEMATGIGTQIEVRLPDKTLTGIFTDLDTTGALLLKTKAGIIPILAGDVFFTQQKEKHD